MGCSGGSGTHLVNLYSIKNIPVIKVNGNKEVLKTITIYRQAGCKRQEIQATSLYLLPFTLCRNLEHFNPLFRAVFKVQKQQSNMFIFLPAKSAF